MPQPDSPTSYCRDYRHLLLLVNQIVTPLFFFPSAQNALWPGLPGELEQP